MALLNWFGRLLSVFYPDRCVVCDRIGFNTICPSCRNSVSFFEGPLLSSVIANPKFDCVMCVAKAEGPWLDAIHKFKYGRRIDLVEPFSKVMSGFATAMKRPDFIVPVPAEKGRICKRGYNQSALLAGRLGKLLRLNVLYDAVLKIAKTPPQVGLTMEERLKNLRGAFVVNKKRRHLLKSSSILIVDDVLTTGATVNETARALKSAGAIRVDVLTLARAA